jgi:hypothetical protein
MERIMEKVTALDGAKIADAVYRFDNQVGVYEIAKDKDTKQPIIYNNPTTDLQITLYRNTETGNYVIAFRGTEPLTYGDWDTNVRMFVSTLVDTLPIAFGEALQVIDPMIEKYGLNSGNTSIVGHSMGGSLAQYLGASTGFETLTYNAYGVSGMDMVPNSSGENITNYITMHDFVSTLLGSEMLGKTYMLQDETLLSVGGHGITNFTSEENWVRGYSPVDDPRDIDVIWGDPNDDFRIHANINGSYDDIIFGGEKYNLLIGGSGNDTLYGMGGSDNLQGGKGDDTLYGGDEDEDDGVFDALYGGEGYDTYIAGDKDIIFDEDGKGIVIFEDARLTGGKCSIMCDPTSKSDDGVYEGNGGIYTLEEGVLTFTKSSGEVLVINNFKNGDLGIRLGKEVPENPTPEEPYHHGSPLVLDLNNDGITSTFIYKTSTYFDLDNDGTRERTGWVQSTDGLLVLDKNNDNIVNSGNELFGNYTKDSSGRYANNGFDALVKYDDNHDGMINSSDNVYKALKVWQDIDSDGITDEGELKTLSELGISSINLSYATVNALEERNSIRETSTFTTQSTDANGNVTTQVNVVNDVWFDRDVKDTKSTTDYTQISNEIKSLGNVSGSGDVEDLVIAMSKDSVLMTKVEALIDAMQNGESLDKLGRRIINFTSERKVA